jgi:hypothetical protein
MGDEPESPIGDVPESEGLFGPAVVLDKQPAAQLRKVAPRIHVAEA